MGVTGTGAMSCSEPGERGDRVTALHSTPTTTGLPDTASTLITSRAEHFVHGKKVPSEVRRASLPCLLLFMLTASSHSHPHAAPPSTSESTSNLPRGRPGCLTVRGPGCSTRVGQGPTRLLARGCRQDRLSTQAASVADSEGHVSRNPTGIELGQRARLGQQLKIRCSLSIDTRQIIDHRLS